MLTRDLNKLLSEMSLEEKVGQLLLIGFEGRRPNREVAEFIKEGKVGGVVLLSRNAEEAGEAADLICVLQKLATAGSHALPLFIAVDQEGGSVVRLTEGVTVFPSNMALGATGCSDYALLAAEAVGGELASLGVNMNFAPVLDVNNNPRNPVIGIRSFGEDPELVAEFGKMAIKGYQNRGVATVAKHFPGHGDTAFDSHLTMPRVPYTMERLFQLELVPFQAAIACGVDCIMTAHLAFPAIEANPGLPATLSETVLTGLLRQKMGFDGLII
ncbi:MAG TPA: glycoside hydrolase, partial [Firmicutes bacterium]|nr:glycoside hydrolase [Bacillota bacterium]